MSNYCDYQMKIKGKRKNVLNIVRYLKTDYETKENEQDRTFYNLDDKEYHISDYHPYRVFEVYWDGSKFPIKTLIGEEELKKPEKEITLEVWGQCAWSVLCCMFREVRGTEPTYFGYDKTLKEAITNKPIDINSGEMLQDYYDNYSFVIPCDECDEDNEGEEEYEN